MSLVRYLGCVFLCATAVGLGSCRAGKPIEMKQRGIQEAAMHNYPAGKRPLYEESGDMRAPSLYYEGTSGGKD